MQRLSIGSPGPKFNLADAAREEADEKAAKPARPAPDKSIHLIPLLTLLCFLVLFLLSRDPSLTDSPALAAATVTARSLEAKVDTTAAIGSSGHRRLKEDPRLTHSRRLGMALRQRLLGQSN